MTRDAEGKTFTYDALNKQTEVKNSSNQSLGKYIYDGEGKRIKKLGNLENTAFVYDAFGSLIAEYAIDAPQPNPSPNISYLTTDLLGSPRIVTGKDGEVLSRRDFLPFGEEIIANEANRKAALGYNYGDATRQTFTGYEKDIETDLEFAQNRYYANKLGRFTTPDPMMASGKVWNPQSWNRYAYVSNNPLNSIDPLGLDPETKPKAWFLPCPTCSPEFGDGYTSKDQIIDPGIASAYYNLAVDANNVWALSIVDGAGVARAFAIGEGGVEGASSLALTWSSAGLASVALASTAALAYLYQQNPSLPVPACIGGSNCDSAGISLGESIVEWITGKPNWRQAHNHDWIYNAMAADEGGASGSTSMSGVSNTASPNPDDQNKPTAKTIDPNNVRFSQNSISKNFKNGESVDGLAQKLKSGEVNPSDVPAIRLVNRNGQLYTLDNRRLEAFRRAGVQVNYRMATRQEIKNESWKFTTTNNGTSIKVRN